MATRNVIIGGGPAATYAVDTLRAIDPAAEITLVCDEPAYARMALPYYLAGQVPEAQTLIASPEYFARQRVTPLLGRRAASLDTDSRSVTLDDGQAIEYDNLLLATGARANRIPVPGSELPGVQTLWTLADARTALAGLPEGAEVCLVGAGFIGCIILNALHKRGCLVRVVEIAPQILPRMLDARAAALAERWLADRGVMVHTADEVTAIVAGPRKKVQLRGGAEFPADLVILATGITPNVELARAAGIEVRSGIVVDRRCRTNAPGVYAGGDCAEGPDRLTDGHAVHAIQPTAVDHGRVAGANMGGRQVEYPGSLSMNILDLCGLQCASFGDWAGAGREIDELLNPDMPLYRKLVWDGGRMVGGLFAGPMNDVCMLNDVGMVKGFIQDGADLREWRQYVRESPADLRRAYVGSGVAARLASFQLLGGPSESRAYRFEDRQPASDPGPAHRTFIAPRSG